MDASRQQQFDLGTIRQPGQTAPAPNAQAFYQSEGGADLSSAKPYSIQDRYAIFQHYKKDMKRVDAGGAPSQELTQSYDALRSALPGQADRAAQVVKPKFGESNYPNADSLIGEMRDTGGFTVDKTSPDQATVAWDADSNDKFRALHDTLAHGGAGTTFSYEGEALANEAHRSTLPQAAHRAITAEVLGQATHHEFGGGFVNQRGLYDVPDWAAKGEPRPRIQKAGARQNPGVQGRLF